MSSINLLPPQIKEDQLYARRNRSLRTFARLAIIAATLSVGVLILQKQLLSTQVNHINEQLGVIRDESSTLGSVESQAARDEKELNQYASLSNGRPDWSFVLSSLAKLTPKNLYITAISTPTASKTPLKIEGSAKDRTSIASMVDSMNQSGLFSDVSLENSAPDFDQVNFAKYTFEIDATTTTKVDR